MNSTQSFVIAVPVSANKRLIKAKGRRDFINSKGYQRWFDMAVIQLKQQRTNPTITGRVKVAITMHYSDHRRRDLDNSLKGFFDACSHAGVWEDDCQIDDIHVVRAEVMKPGCLVAEITEIATLVEDKIHDQNDI